LQGNLVSAAVLAPGGGSFFLQPFERLALSFAIAPIAAPVENADEIMSTVS